MKIMGIVSNKTDVVSFTVANGPYCKTEKMAIDLLCFCYTPWIEGSTSKALYGKKKQKIFNVHCCSNCNNWYHTHCLQFLGIEVSKKRSDSFCPSCTVPDTPKWHHDLFTNTCTVDNAITIKMIACKENPQLLSFIGSSAIERSLHACIQLMLRGETEEGKSIILKFVQSKINLPITGGKYDFVGNETNRFLCLLTHIFRLIVSQKFNTLHCPTAGNSITKYRSSFSFTSESYHKQLHSHFPMPGDYINSYCGYEFCEEPPPDSEIYLNNRITLDENGDKIQQNYYVCSGTPAIVRAVL